MAPEMEAMLRLASTTRDTLKAAGLKRQAREGGVACGGVVVLLS
jgi:hypothetical protein